MKLMNNMAICLVLFGNLMVAHAEQKSIVVDGSTTVGPIAKAFAEYYMSLHPDVNITISESGSGNGAKSLLNGTCDIADMSRFMKGGEFKAAVDKEIYPIAHVVALDGLVVVVHPSNPVSGLTVDQIRAIYLGEILNWKQLGGPDKNIVIISRDTNSGTFETFHKLVMEKQAITKRAEYVGSNGQARQRVMSTPSAIGFVGLGFVDDSVKALKVDGVAPSMRSISSGKYPIARPLFMFTNGYPGLGTDLQGFVSLYLTEKGQEIIEETGFIPLTQY